MSAASKLSRALRSPNTVRRSVVTAAAIAALSLSACDSYWWTRGQPPAPSDLVKRASDSFDAELAKNAQARSDFAPKAKELKALLVTIAQQSSHRDAAEQIVPTLREASQTFLGIEDSLSIGSRPAFAELSGQLRRLTADVEKTSSVEATVVETFVSRSLFLLSNELTVPAPAFL